MYGGCEKSFPPLGPPQDFRVDCSVGLLLSALLWSLTLLILFALWLERCSAFETYGLRTLGPMRSACLARRMVEMMLWLL